MKQQNGGAPARAVIGEAEAVHGSTSVHTAEYPAACRTGWVGPAIN
jgi:hypothetical protein